MTYHAMVILTMVASALMLRTQTYCGVVRRLIRAYNFSSTRRDARYSLKEIADIMLDL